MFSKRHKAIIRQLDEIMRIQRLQGEAHSTLMTQMSTVYDAVRKAEASIQERISFKNRPTP